MNATDLVLNGIYVHVDPGFPNDPVKAHAGVEDPEEGLTMVDVVLEYPDLGAIPAQVNIETLVGEWDSPPTGDRWKAALDELAAAGKEPTWANIAKARYELVRRQRDLADRLAATTGVERAHQHYAGRGGSASNARDVNLQLNYDELDELLRTIERTPAAISPDRIPQLPMMSPPVAPAVAPRVQS